MKKLAFIIVLFVCISAFGQNIRMVGEVNNGLEVSSPKLLTALNNNLYFLSTGPQFNLELWKYNEEQGFNKLDSIGETCYGSASNWMIENWYCQTNIISVIGDNLYYPKYNTLYRYCNDNEKEKVFELPLGEREGYEYCIAHQTVLNNKFYFIYNGQLWVYDGQDKAVQDSTFQTMEHVFFYSRMFNFCAYKNCLYYGSEGPNFSKLWRYDGVKIPEVVFSFDSIIDANTYCPTEMNVLNNKLYFTYKRSIWVYDGESEPQRLAKLPDGYLEFTVTSFNEMLYFYTNDTYIKLWAFNGRTTFTEILSFDNLVYTLDMFVFNNELFFLGYDKNNGNELWTYDGINEPKLFADINPGEGSSDPSNFYEFNNKLYFSADDGIHGSELWVYEPDNINHGNTERSTNVLKVFPNPTNQTLNIQLTSLVSKVCNLKIYNLTGKQILTQTLNLSVDKVGSTNQTVDVSNLEKGYYIISVSDKAGNKLGSQGVVVY